MLNLSMIEKHLTSGQCEPFRASWLTLFDNKLIDEIMRHVGPHRHFRPARGIIERLLAFAAQAGQNVESVAQMIIEVSVKKEERAAHERALQVQRLNTLNEARIKEEREKNLLSDFSPAERKMLRLMLQEWQNAS